MPFGTVLETPADMVNRAAHAVCGQAADAEEARTLLAMLGIEPTGRPEPAPVSVPAAPAPGLPDGVERCPGEDCTRLTRPIGTTPVAGVTTVPRHQGGLCVPCHSLARRPHAARR